MVKLIELILKIVMLPILFFREDFFGGNLKDKIHFIRVAFVTNFYIKKRIKLGDVKALIPVIDKEEFLKNKKITNIKVEFDKIIRTKSGSRVLEQTKIRWDDKQKKLKKDILDGKYVNGLNNKYIYLSRDNVVIDGHHRISALLEKYGDDYTLVVKRNPFKDWVKIMKLWLEYTWNNVKFEQKNYDIKDNRHALQMWEEIMKDTDGGNLWDQDKEKCHLILILWNNTFPDDRINIDE